MQKFKRSSMSPEKRNSPEYRHRSRSNSRSRTYRRHNRSPNRHKQSYYADRRTDSDYDSDRADYNRDKGHSWEGPEHRGRDRRRPNRVRDRERRRSRSEEGRWEKKSEDRKRDRDRYPESDGERSPNGGFIGASGTEIIGYKCHPPNNTIMIRGLAQHITEYDIRQDIIDCNLVPKDIRLIRKKDTGASRGFAFVEFSTLEEATRWMDVKKGVLMLHDHYRAIMQYSIPKDFNFSDKPTSYKLSADWFCIKCAAQNFKRRDNCFKCHASRTESEEGGSGSDEVCNYVTKTIMMRNLDALTTEDSVMAELNIAAPELVKSISAICIGRDPLTSTSRGICYLGTESTMDALSIFGTLSSMKNSLTVDGKPVILSYCKYNMGDTSKPYSQDDNEAFPNAAVPSTYAMADVDGLAEYASRRYAKTPQEYINYISYYRDYFSKQISSGQSITLQENQMDAVNAAAAVAQAAIQQMNASNSNAYNNTQAALPTGTDGIKYPVPDITKYVYDKTTGYQYDQSTGLYYDPNSCYYWNCVIQKYLYWDNDKMTYLLAPEAENTTTQPTPQEPETKKQKPEKQDKVKVAKKIAKDMERWAKTLNQKKDAYPVRSVVDHGTDSSSASADIGFSVLEKKSASQLPSHSVNPFNTDIEEPLAMNKVPSAGTALVAAYGGESESSGDEQEDFLDFEKLICNLCKRQLASLEALQKHAKLSTLHKQNLEARKKKNDNSSEKIVYRDRAKERRLKYGDSEPPQPSKLKEKYLMALESEMVLGSESVGNRLLQKMGWSEGQGLGKQNQGRTTIIQAERYSSQVGLGNKVRGYPT